MALAASQSVSAGRDELLWEEELARVRAGCHLLAPAAPNTSGCDPSTNNTGTCDHTAIATQTSGTGIFTVNTKKK